MSPPRVSEDNEPTDKVLQLSDIPRPVIGTHDRHGLGRQIHRAAVLGVEPSPEGLSQDRDGLKTLAQRGDMDLEDIEAIVQILAELTVVDRRLEISIGRRNDANIGSNRLPTPDARELKILENMEQLRLKRRGHFPDLVQAQGTAARELEPTGLSTIGSCKRPLFVTEQLGLQ